MQLARADMRVQLDACSFGVITRYYYVYLHGQFVFNLQLIYNAYTMFEQMNRCLKFSEIVMLFVSRIAHRCRVFDINQTSGYQR